jgi:hypothetical protein
MEQAALAALVARLVVKVVVRGASVARVLRVVRGRLAVLRSGRSSQFLLPTAAERLPEEQVVLEGLVVAVVVVVRPVVVDSGLVVAMVAVVAREHLAVLVEPAVMVRRQAARMEQPGTLADQRLVGRAAVAAARVEI